ncbi:MAG TPA: glycosyltransferase family 39 protein [Pyrinomonadaceae bacterium]|nr:glycosyltransferase family 39 protein [Pyrinomonadaceae bacterium]
MSRDDRRTLLWLSAILLAGAAVRVYGLGHGFPFEVHVDESFIVNPVLEMYRAGTLRPKEFLYPSLVYYVLLACAHLVGLFKEPTAFDLYVAGRLASAAFGTGTIALVFLTARRAYGERTGLLASAFYAFTVTALRESHYYTTDSLNTFFIALGVRYVVKVALGDPARSYLWAGAAAGLAAGSKYNGALLLVPLLAAHLLRDEDEAKARREIEHGTSEGAETKTRRDAGASARHEGGTSPSFAARLKSLFFKLLSPRLVAAGLLSFVVFLLTTPYALIDRTLFLEQFARIGPSLSRELTAGNHQYLGTTPYWYYLSTLLFWAMGPALEAACLAGLLFALARRRKADVVILVWLAVYFGLVGGWLNKVTRYTLPMLPFLCVLGARLFVESAALLRERGRRRLARIVNALACLTLASAMLYALAYLGIYARPHTGVEAARWLYANAPEGSVVLLEEPTPQERPQPDAMRVIYPDEFFNAGARRFRFKYLWVPKFVPLDADPAPLRAELQETLAGVEYVVMSTRWYEGLHDSPAASPVIRDYYRSLADGTAGFELIKEFTSRPRLFCFEADDDASELNFRVFDRPKVWIFRRRTDAPAAQRR